MAEKIKNFQDLRIWQKGIEVVKDIYILTKKFSKEELYGLTSQMRRSAVSVPSNIAEGLEDTIIKNTNNSCILQWEAVLN